MALDQKARFLIVGAYNTGFGYAVFAALFLALGHAVHYLLIVTLAYFAALANSFLMQRHFVFRHRGTVFQSFFRFNVVTGAMLLLNLASMALLVDLADVHPLVAQAAVTVLSAVMLYFIHRQYTFAAPGQTKSDSSVPSEH